MSAVTEMFNNGSKVVISPDKMRAWVSLAKPQGVKYTAEAITEWLPQQGVVYGADPALIAKAAATKAWDDLLEVARGTQPQAATGGDYTLKVDTKPFTGLKGGADGSLYYDDLTFLQEVQPGQVLADILPGRPAQVGHTVTGEELQPRAGEEGRALGGSGFQLSADGTAALAPGLSLVSVVNEQLFVTPLLRAAEVRPDTGDIDFEGSVLVEGDIHPGSVIKAGGSVFVVGKAAGASIQAGNNVLLCQGMRAGAAGAVVEAKGNVWGLLFESCEITAGSDICSNYLSDCRATAGGRANILGGRGAVAGGTLTAADGVLAGVLGNPQSERTTINAGLPAETMDRYEAVVKKTAQLEIDLNALQQSVAAYERVNRHLSDRGRGQPAYKEMAAKVKQQVSVLNILTQERTRMKRVVELSTATSVVARETVYPEVTVNLNGRPYHVGREMGRTKFRFNKDRVEVVAPGARD